METYFHLYKFISLLFFLRYCLVHKMLKRKIWPISFISNSLEGFTKQRHVNLMFLRKDIVTAKIETSFALERNDPLGPLDDGGPRGTKPRRLSDVHFIDVARDPAVSEILHLSWTGVQCSPRANVILIKSGGPLSPFDLRVKLKWVQACFV